MSRRTRALLMAFIVLSIAGIALLVITRYRPSVGIRSTLNEGRKVEVRVEKVHYSGTKDGRLEWELDAASATRAKDEDETVFETAVFTFYSKDGKPYKLSAPEGTYSESSSEVRAAGGVAVESGEGYTLKVASIVYSMDARRITSEDPVEIRTDWMDVEGVGLSVDLDSGRLQIKKQVTAVIRKAAL